MNKVISQLKQIKITEAARFVLPMLYSKDRNANFFITKNFENCYIGDANHPELGNKIYLLYNYQLTVEYLKFERVIELIPEFLTDFDYGSERQVMYVLDVPDQFKTDFEHFLKGEYSKFSRELTENIEKFWKLTGIESMMLNAIDANDKAKENPMLIDKDCAPGEYWPKPVLTREIFMNSD